MTIEEDGERLTDVLARNLFKKFCAVTIKIKKHLRRGEARSRTAPELERSAREIATRKTGRNECDGTGRLLRTCRSGKPKFKGRRLSKRGDGRFNIGHTGQVHDETVFSDP